MLAQGSEFAMGRNPSQNSRGICPHWQLWARWFPRPAQKSTSHWLAAASLGDSFVVTPLVPNHCVQPLCSTIWIVSPGAHRIGRRIIRAPQRASVKMQFFPRACVLALCALILVTRVGATIKRRTIPDAGARGLSRHLLVSIDPDAAPKSEHLDPSVSLGTEDIPASDARVQKRSPGCREPEQASARQWHVADAMGMGACCTLVQSVGQHHVELHADAHWCCRSSGGPLAAHSCTANTPLDGVLWSNSGS
jgi:hypothetical protein